MAKVTADQAAKKWASRLSSATQDIQNGVNNVTSSPTAAAASKADKWQQRLADPNTKAKFQAGLNAVSLDQWKQATLTKGLPRIASGAQAATPKFTDFMSKLLPYQDQLSAKVATMPDLTLQDSIQRMVTFVQGMASFKKS